MGVGSRLTDRYEGTEYDEATAVTSSKWPGHIFVCSEMIRQSGITQTESRLGLSHRRLIDTGLLAPHTLGSNGTIRSDRVRDAANAPGLSSRYSTVYRRGRTSCPLSTADHLDQDRSYCKNGRPGPLAVLEIARTRYAQRRQMGV